MPLFITVHVIWLVILFHYILYILRQFSVLRGLNSLTQIPHRDVLVWGIKFRWDKELQDKERRETCKHEERQSKEEEKLGGSIRNLEKKIDCVGKKPGEDIESPIID